MVLRRLFFTKSKQLAKVYSYQKFIGKKQNQCNLKNKLLNMLDGNDKEVDKLIAKARFADPGKSHSYYYHKAIVYLEKSKGRINNN